MMFGFNGLGETAINEFPPYGLDHVPKTCRVFLIPAFRIAEQVIRSAYLAVVRIVP